VIDAAGHCVQIVFTDSIKTIRTEYWGNAIGVFRIDAEPTVAMKSIDQRLAKKIP
jgi:hypothetical protein